jgi:hypothetical protein
MKWVSMLLLLLGASCSDAPNKQRTEEQTPKVSIAKICSLYQSNHDLMQMVKNLKRDSKVERPYFDSMMAIISDVPSCPQISDYALKPDIKRAREPLLQASQKYLDYLPPFCEALKSDPEFGNFPSVQQYTQQLRSNEAEFKAAINEYLESIR